MNTRGKLDARVTSTTQGTSQKMGVDIESAGSLMLMLSQIYSASGESVLREYANNARDSHLEAGQDRPIEVSLPSHMSPNLVVRDTGAGLDLDGVLRTFTYGASTKRTSAKFVGHIGIGSKSALTISTQFSVTAVKDGLRTVVLIFLDGDGDPSTEILASEVPTDDPNGVEVSIPVGLDDMKAMRDSVTRVFGMWPRGLALVDGEEPPRLADGFDLELGDVCFVDEQCAEDNDLGEITVEMGGSLYGTPPAVVDAFWDVFIEAGGQRDRDKPYVIARVPMDAVDIVATREDVRDTPRTRDAVRAAARSALSSIGPVWESRMDMDLPSRAAMVLTLARPFFGPEVRPHSEGANFSAGRKVGGNVYSRGYVESSTATFKPLGQGGSVVGIKDLASTVFIVNASLHVGPSLVKKWVYAGGAEGKSIIVLAQASTVEMLGSAISASERHGLHVMDYSELSEAASGVSLPQKPSPDHMLYPTRKLGESAGRRRDSIDTKTAPQIAGLFEDGTITSVLVVAQDIGYSYPGSSIEKLFLDRSAEGHSRTLVVHIEGARTVNAFIDRLRRASQDIPIHRLQGFRGEVMLPVLRDLVDEVVVSSTGERSRSVEAVAARSGELHPSVLSYIETFHPGFMKKAPAPSQLAVKHRAGLLNIAKSAGIPVLSSFEDAALGSPWVRGKFASNRVSSAGESEVDDIIVVLNSRHEVAEAALREHRTALAA